MTPRFLFILSPSPRCGTNFLFDVLSLDQRFRIPRIDEDHFIAGFPIVTSFLDRSFQKSSLHADGRGSLKAEAALAMSKALLETCGIGEGPPSDAIPVFKTPSTRGLADAFLTFPESCRFLVIVRDGRDVIESSVRSFPWINFAYALHRWRLGCEELAKAEALGSDCVLRIHYEDLLNEPATTVTRIFQWLQWSTESFPFDRIQSIPVRGSSETRCPEGSVSWTPSHHPLSIRPDQRSRSATRWRRVFFTAFGEEWNERLGYDRRGLRCGKIEKRFAGILWFFQALRYRFFPSLRDLANRDMGGAPPLFP
jgi:hypothetical protein